MARISTKGLNLWAKLMVRVCPVLTARNRYTNAKTLEAMADTKQLGDLSYVRKGSKVSMHKLRWSILHNPNVTTKAIRKLWKHRGMDEHTWSILKEMEEDGIDKAKINKIAEQEVDIVHISDIHAFYMEDAPGENPLSRLTGFVDSVRQKNRKRNVITLFTFGGDFFEKGSVAELLSKGWSTLDVFQLLGFDVAVIGNHDPAYGIKQFLAYTQTLSNTVMLASNMKYIGDNPSEYGGRRYWIFEEMGLKILFCGCVARGRDAQNKQLKASNDYYPKKFETTHDYEEIIREIIDEHGDSVDVTVMLSHIGLNADRKIAKSMEGGIILSGHSHDGTPEPYIDEDGTKIVQTDAYAKNIAYLKLRVDRLNGRVLGHEFKLIENKPGSLPNNKTIAKTIKDVELNHAPQAYDPLASVGKYLGKPEIAKIAADAAIHHLEIDAAFVDVDNVWRDKWKPGDINQQALAMTFPEEIQPSGTDPFNAFYIVEIAGSQLYRMHNYVKDPDRWIFSGPLHLDLSGIYKLALPKKAVLFLKNYFGGDIKFESEPVHGCQIWQAVDKFGRYMDGESLNIDNKQPVREQIW